jgi:hypothetical protein
VTDLGYDAEVAELADAADSKSAVRKGLRVRVPPSALVGLSTAHKRIRT